MRVVELKDGQPTLNEVMLLAQREAIVLRNTDGQLFALAPVNDFDVEVELLKKNPEFMAFLDELSQEQATVSLQSLRAELEL